jgi:pimeloyl-ACP methyl ester carboxylesterase
VPLQTVVFFPGSGSLRLGPDPDPRAVLESNEFVASGRAFLWPIYRYTSSRGEADRPVGMNTTWPRPTREYADLVRSWVSEVRRSIDFIESRPGLDPEKIAYVGNSWGGRLAAIVPAVELGGLASGHALPEVDQINYVTRITVPTLMLNGLHDPLEPLESSQLPMYRLLGTPAENKRHVQFDEWGHGLPTNERIRESLGFLDRYLGPVN